MEKDNRRLLCHFVIIYADRRLQLPIICRTTSKLLNCLIQIVEPKLQKNATENSLSADQRLIIIVLR